jgi:hypothetical protein
MDILITALILLFAHCLGDFSLQSSFLSQFKGRDKFTMIVHCVIYTGTIIIALWASPLDNKVNYLLVSALLMITHYVIDMKKARSIIKPNVNQTKAYHLDQFCHFVVLVIVLVSLIV